MFIYDVYIHTYNIGLGRRPAKHWYWMLSGVCFRRRRRFIQLFIKRLESYSVFAFLLRLSLLTTPQHYHYHKCAHYTATNSSSLENYWLRLRQQCDNQRKGTENFGAWESSKAFHINAHNGIRIPVGSIIAIYSGKNSSVRRKTHGNTC